MESPMLDDCITWIKENTFKNVSLHFSKPLLKYSAQVIKQLKSKCCDCEFYVVVSAACGVDYLAPRHLGEDVVDAIVRFGNCCIAPPPNTIKTVPVFFVCSLTDPRAQHSFLEEMLTKISDLDEVLVLFDVEYMEVVSLMTRQKPPYSVAKLYVPRSDWHFPPSLESLISRDKDVDTLGQYHVEDTLDKYKTLAYIGSTVSLHYRINSFSKLIHMDPEVKHISEVDVSREIRKRVGVIEKIKSENVQRFGIVFANSYPEVDDHYSRLKSLSNQIGKAIYCVSLFQSTDECKLGNFADFDAFVIVANCFCSSLIDSMNLHVPLVTLSEFEIACGMRKEYGKILWNNEFAQDQRDFKKGELIAVDDIEKPFWYGLTIQASEDAPSIVKEGLRGIASGYHQEKNT